MSNNRFEGTPSEILLEIHSHLSSVKETASLARVDRHFHGLFQPEVEKQAAKEAAACVIYPVEETKDYAEKVKNITKLKALLTACLRLLLHPVVVKNRHGQEIKGTVYQIALHECDNDLIDDVIRPAFERLHNGLEEMEKQRNTWLPDGWLKAEEKACAPACQAMDAAFAAFITASAPNDVTQLQRDPYTVTINHPGADKALEAARQAIAELYKPRDKPIVGGRDPIIRLMEHFSDRNKENYAALGGDFSPRNSALLQKLYGFCQRFAPINIMEAFAQGIFPLIEEERTLEYSCWARHFILPLDSEPGIRLGDDYYAWADVCAGVLGGRLGDAGRDGLQNFLSIKNSSITTVLRYANS